MATKSFRVPLRIVFYKEDGLTFAHCLEFDLIGDGANKLEAVEQLVAAINIQVQASIEDGNPDNLFSPADGKILEMFAAGKDIGRGEVTVQLQLQNVGGVKFEDTTYREYAGPEAVCV